MAEAVQAVEEEGEGDGRLSSDLRSDRPAGDGGNHGGSLEVPAHGGGHEVGEAEEVEAAAEHDAGDTVERGGDPGDLGAVDGQMRGDGAVTALLDEDLLGLILLNVVGGGHSATHSQYALLQQRPQPATRRHGGALMPSRAPYLRWTMRPAGWILEKLGTAARRRPSWKTRAEAIVINRGRESCRWAEGEFRGGDVVAQM